MLALTKSNQAEVGPEKSATVGTYGSGIELRFSLGKPRLMNERSTHPSDVSCTVIACVVHVSEAVPEQASNVLSSKQASPARASESGPTPRAPPAGVSSLCARTPHVTVF